MSEQKEKSASFARGKITPEAVAAKKAQVGMILRDQGRQGLQTTTEAHPDTIRRYALGIGDDNPLWCDPEYAKATRWRGSIAFPTYNVDGLAEDALDPSRIVPKGDPLGGMHSFIVGFETTYYRPVYAGDRCSTLSILESVEEKQRREGGSIVKIVRLTRMKNQRGDVVRTVRVPVIFRERTSGDKTERKDDYVKPVYTAEDIAKIDAAYEAETRRGAEPRYWEDVQVGDAIDPIVKGPYTLKDWLGYCVGAGQFGAFGAGTWRLDYLNRKRAPRFYSTTADGIPRSAFACHFDLEVAQAAGVPQCYDVGVMRQAFLTQMLCNWMGDDGFVYKTDMQFRQFNYIGDVQWCEGRVTGVRREADLHLVDAEVSCTNQRGGRTTVGTASVLLPSRAHGPVRLPFPPRDLP